MTCDYDIYWLAREAALIVFGVVLGVWLCVARDVALLSRRYGARPTDDDDRLTLCEGCGGYQSKSGRGDTCECGRMA